MIRNYNNDILSGILFLSKNLNNNFVLKKDDASSIVVGGSFETFPSVHKTFA